MQIAVLGVPVAAVAVLGLLLPGYHSKGRVRLG